MQDMQSGAEGQLEADLFLGLSQISPSFPMVRLQLNRLFVGRDPLPNVPHAGAAQPQRIPGLDILGLVLDSLCGTRHRSHGTLS